MRRLRSLVIVCGLLSGCATPPPAAPRVDPESLYRKPTEIEAAKLRELPGLLQGSVTGLDVHWVVDMGEVAIPTLTHLADDKTLPPPSRNLVLVVLGNTMNKAKLRDATDARKELVVPVLLEALADLDPNIRGAAAYASRHVDDARLVPPLELLLKDKPGVQEQAVLALGTSGGAEQVIPIAKLFFATDSGVFRYSCISALAILCLRHDVDAEAILREHANDFGENNHEHVESLIGRFEDFQRQSSLVKRLGAGEPSQRQKAYEELRLQSQATIAFDPQADSVTRAKQIELWQNYLLTDFWRAPKPQTNPADGRNGP